MCIRPLAPFEPLMSCRTSTFDLPGRKDGLAKLWTGGILGKIFNSPHLMDLTPIFGLHRRREIHGLRHPLLPLHGLRKRTSTDFNHPGCTMTLQRPCSWTPWHGGMLTMAWCLEIQSIRARIFCAQQTEACPGRQSLANRCPTCFLARPVLRPQMATSASSEIRHGCSQEVSSHAVCEPQTKGKLGPFMTCRSFKVVA